MPDDKTHWFKLKDDVGLDAAGNPAPLHESTAFSFPRLTLAGVIQDKASATVLKDSRVLSTDDEHVARSIVACGLYEEIKAPTAKEKQAYADETKTSRERNEKRLARFEKAANPEAPVGAPDNLTTLVETED